LPPVSPQLFSDPTNGTEAKNGPTRKKKKYTIFHWLSSLIHNTTPSHSQNKNPSSAGTTKGEESRHKEASEGKFHTDTARNADKTTA